MTIIFVLSFVAALVGILILGRAVYFAVKEVKTAEYTPNGDPAEYTWQDFPEIMGEQTHRLVFGFSSIAVAIMFFCVGVLFL